MVERLYLRDLVSFKELELEFEQGLVVFSGPSGAGKSVLISAILSSFGYAAKGAAALCEVNLQKPSKLQSDAFVLEENLCIKTLKKEKLRYFIDGQSISKKALAEMFAPYIKYLTVRDQSGFDSASLIGMIDRSLSAKDKTFKKSLKEYKKRYANYRSKELQLEKIEEDEAKLAEKMEFAQYEIDKISLIDPKVGEEEKLLKVKQQLSHIDKVRDALSRASEIFHYESSVEEVYRLLDKDVTPFSEAMGQLRADFEESEMLADELEEIDVEEVLDRLSELMSLKSRYGSIEEALSYRDEKIKELEGYRHIAQDKSMLQSFLQIEFSELNIIASRLSQLRRKEAAVLEASLADYLSSLKLPPLYFDFYTEELGENGIDSVEVRLGASMMMDTLSGGEFNRVRLALMAATMPQERQAQGVLILDEIDANVSGDESIAIAEMIATLAKGYQIFAISHQPHLSAKATQHIVVEKESGVSRARVLDEEGRIAEICRIIAGENPTEQAVAFARKLRS
ncbi:DNA recombination protein RecN [Sulfurovum sp. ST-21]|uniref:DNA repair protein RecN n=1 Tax=Sulfurovum indicum TaxID=2779528 RepID=A0A7M1S226_9BACT|nr:DNA recombination protein RecN [Sulfurovum indicum]QOR61091.1 DNA recombination protein RecN [Sulfurovum indicum]